jgi:hypothetical protein
MNPEVKVMVKFFTLTVNGVIFEFNHSGHCEQVLRGFVHSGYEVVIKEVSEIRTVTQSELDQYRNDDVNFRHVDEPKMISEDRCETQTVCDPARIDRISGR